MAPGETSKLAKVPGTPLELTVVSLPLEEVGKSFWNPSSTASCYEHSDFKHLFFWTRARPGPGTAQLKLNSLHCVVLRLHNRLTLPKIILDYSGQSGELLTR